MSYETILYDTDGAIATITFSRPERLKTIVPQMLEDLDAAVRELAEKLASLPLSQLAAMKLIVNQAYENMGLASTQLLGPVLDGYMRNTPEALRFVEVAARVAGSASRV